MLRVLVKSGGVAAISSGVQLLCSSRYVAKFPFSFMGKGQNGRAVHGLDRNTIPSFVLRGRKGGSWRPQRCRRQPLSLIHISEPTRLLSISYAVFCLKKK